MTASDVKSNYKIEDIIGQHLSLKGRGARLEGNCPFHNDTHASLKVNTTMQRFDCFVCDIGGDMIDFFTKQGQSFKEAINSITNGTVMPSVRHEPKIPEVVWKNDIPDQNNLPDVANLTFKDYGKPSMFWEYDDADSNGNRIVIGYVLRFDFPDGKKDVIPYTYKTDGKTSRWQWRGFDLPRPMYNLYQIKKNPKAIVLMVEGEKTAAAGQKLFPKYVSSTWIGGGENIKNSDLSPLTGRNVYAWPDNDLAGLHCMFGGWSKNEKTNVYRRIKGLCEIVDANVKWIKNHPTFPKKWDIADAEWTPEEALEYLKANRNEIPVVSEHAPNEIPEQNYSIEDLSTPGIEVVHVVSAPSEPVHLNIVVPSKPETPKSDDSSSRNPYFRCYGFEKENDHIVYVFFAYRTNVVVKMSASGISTSSLLQLAPLHYWESNYPKSTRSGPKFEINTVADHLTSVCSNMGFFSSKNIRGRGAWIDNGQPVLHCGSSLVVNNVPCKFGNHKSKFIYEAGEELGFAMAKPLGNKDANNLVTMLSRLNWKRKISAKLLSGWIVVAPICGALDWRPHVWITGAAGSGKSDVMKMFPKEFLKNISFNIQGKTTEAGIRRKLIHDAIPVVYDESESENSAGKERMQSVLEFIRASSTSEGGDIVMANSSGGVDEFKPKSCFCLSSINHALSQRSDFSRTSVLEIVEDSAAGKEQRWHDFQEDYYKLFTQEYIEAFQSRSISLMQVIIANAKTFSIAASIELGNQRSGDQLGALLSGAYSLYSDKLISLDAAKQWVKEQDWSEERLIDATKDEVKVLHKIISSAVSVETITGHGRVTRTIGELIMVANGSETKDVFDAELSNSTLKRIGISVEGDFLLISDTSTDIFRMLLDTPYSKNYHIILSRFNGSEKMPEIRFAGYLKTSATKIEIKNIFGEINSTISPTEIEIHKTKHANQTNDLFSK